MFDVPTFAATATLSILLWRRISERDKVRKRLQELDQVRTYLSSHADHLQEFLEHPGAPVDLKAMLIRFSDTMANEKMAVEMVRFLAEKNDHGYQSTPEGEALLRTLDELLTTQPDLAESFRLAVVSGALAGFTRWPEAAEAAGSVTPRFVTDPKQEAETVAEGARRWGERFGLQPSSAIPA